MNMSVFTAAIASMALIAATCPADARIDQRQSQQRARIDKGIADGSLTARETARLERRQSRIAAIEARDRADGGRLTSRERANIESRQDRASANIYRQKRDRQRN